MVIQTKAILNSILREMGDRAIVVVVQKADDQVANFSTLAKVRDMIKKENIIVGMSTTPPQQLYFFLNET